MALREFTPTWLYIKQHSVTGVKYFGKCVNSEKFLLERYMGSGKYWQHHILKHGVSHVTTIWHCQFDDEDDLVEFATFFSEEMNIVNAVDNDGKKVWANLKPETGIDGGGSGIAWNKGIRWTEEQKLSHSLKVKGVKKPPRTDTHKANLSKSNIGLNIGNKDSAEVRKIKSLAAINRHKEHPRTLESIAKQSAAMKTKEKIRCPHCEQNINGKGNFMRWHNDNCKSRTNNE